MTVPKKKTRRPAAKAAAADGYDVFDWRTVPDVDPDGLAMWMSRTDASERQFPLQVALQVHDELVRQLMSPAPMDAARLSEIRGGVKALARFAQVYAATLGARRKEGD